MTHITNFTRIPLQLVSIKEPILIRSRDTCRCSQSKCYPVPPPWQLVIAGAFSGSLSTRQVAHLRHAQSPKHMGPHTWLDAVPNPRCCSAWSKCMAPPLQWCVDIALKGTFCRDANISLELNNHCFLKDKHHFKLTRLPTYPKGKLPHSPSISLGRNFCKAQKRCRLWGSCDTLGWATVLTW